MDELTDLTDGPYGPNVPWGFAADPAVIGGVLSLMEGARSENPGWLNAEGEVIWEHAQAYKDLVLSNLLSHFSHGALLSGQPATLPVVAGSHPSPN
tara:strand:- start:290 stop:577 length:288 start_codon:yes stop_codon:yes gene_type:complete